MQDTGPGNGKNAGWCEAGMPRVLAQLLPLGQLPGSLAQLLPLGRLPGSLARGICQAWVSVSVYLEKFLRFLISQELFLTRGPSRPIEALFTAQSGLTRELLTSKFHIDPRTSLLTLPREGDVPLAVGHHKIILYQSLHISHIQWIFLRLKS